MHVNRLAAGRVLCVNKCTVQQTKHTVQHSTTINVGDTWVELGPETGGVINGPYPPHNGLYPRHILTYHHTRYTKTNEVSPTGQIKGAEKLPQRPFLKR